MAHNNIGLQLKNVLFVAFDVLTWFIWICLICLSVLSVLAGLI